MTLMCSEERAEAFGWGWRVFRFLQISKRGGWVGVLSCLVFIANGLFSCCLTAQEEKQASPAETVRFATFNTSLYRSGHGQLIRDLENEAGKRPAQVANVIQIVRPDVVLLNEFDFDPEGQAARLFLENFLAKAQGENKPIRYEHIYFAPVNTGVDSGFDLDGDGRATGTANDAFGFGKHPGQYGMLVLSRYPIDVEGVRTFQKFLWKDMPDNQWPIVPKTKKPYYSDEVKEIFRLSSKSHWDVPIQVGERTIHFLVSHPTPPVFDQEEDKNGCRNHDEIRFWADFVDPQKSEYVYDDLGGKGGLAKGADFVIAGDLNADSNDGDSRNQAARLLTTHPLINNELVPSSEGAKEAAERSAGKNREHSGDPSWDTGDFNDSNVGNLRIDYVLPSRTLDVLKTGVFWPKRSDPHYGLINASDHRLVWIDLKMD